MKSLISILLAVAIFGPRIEWRDSDGQIRFTYTGILYGIVQYVYWTVDKVTNKEDR